MTHDESLGRAIEDARRCAAEAGENCYILHSRIYANTYHEYDEMEHVVGIRAAFATLYRNWQVPAYNSKLVGVVSPDGQAFLNQIEDILAQAFGKLNDHTARSTAGETDTLVMQLASQPSHAHGTPERKRPADTKRIGSPTFLSRASRRAVKRKRK